MFEHYKNKRLVRDDEPGSHYTFRWFEEDQNRVCVLKNGTDHQYVPKDKFLRDFHELKIEEDEEYKAQKMKVLDWLIKQGCFCEIRENNFEWD